MEAKKPASLVEASLSSSSTSDRKRRNTNAPKSTTSSSDNTGMDTGMTRMPSPNNSTFKDNSSDQSVTASQSNEGGNGSTAGDSNEESGRNSDSTSSKKRGRPSKRVRLPNRKFNTTTSRRPSSEFLPWEAQQMEALFSPKSPTMDVKAVSKTSAESWGNNNVGYLEMDFSGGGHPGGPSMSNGQTSNSAAAAYVDHQATEHASRTAAVYASRVAAESATTSRAAATAPTAATVGQPRNQFEFNQLVL